MTAAASEVPRTALGRRWSLVRARVLTLGWLTLVWILLWGTFSWANLLSGLVVALAVVLVFPLPSVLSTGRLRPLALVRVAGDVAADLAVSSVQVAWQSVRPGPPLRSSIVAVRVEEDSELLLAVLVECLSLVPGSVVVEIDPATRTFWAHVLGAGDDAAVERFRSRVARLEAQLVAAGVHEVRVVPPEPDRARAGTDPRDDPDEDDGGSGS